MHLLQLPRLVALMAAESKTWTYLMQRSLSKNVRETLINVILHNISNNFCGIKIWGSILIFGQCDWWRIQADVRKKKVERDGSSVLSSLPWVLFWFPPCYFPCYFPVRLPCGPHYFSRMEDREESCQHPTQWCSPLGEKNKISDLKNSKTWLAIACYNRFRTG